MNSNSGVTVELFVIEYRCFVCNHQWFETLKEIDPLKSCPVCNDYARSTNVVSLYFIHLVKIGVKLFIAP